MRIRRFTVVAVLCTLFVLALSGVAQAQLCGSLSAPALVSPGNGDTGVSLTPTLKISVSFPMFSLCHHDATQWQVATDSAFPAASIVFDSGFTNADLLTKSLPSGTLNTLTDYWWRARIKDEIAFPFSDKVSPWSATRKFTTHILLVLVCNWGTISNTAPADGSTGIAVTPTLTITRTVPPFPAFPFPCSNSATQWQIASAPIFFGATIVFDSGDSALNLTSLSVPAGTLSFNTTYWWRAKLKSGGGDTSGWTSATSFTTALGLLPPFPLICNWGTISNASPADGATGITITPTLQVSATPAAFFPCTQASSQWQISTDAGFGAITFDSGDDGVNLTSLNIPAGTLSFNTTYWWRVKFKDGSGSTSAWTSATSFTTALGILPPFPVVCNWGTISNASPADGATGLTTTPTLQVSATPAAFLPCTQASSQWQISTDAGFGVVTFDSGDDGVNLTSLGIAAGVLNSDTLYYWRVRFADGGGSHSSWSTATSFRTLVPVPGNQPPNANFSFAPAAPAVGQPVQFSDQSSDPDGVADLATWSWDFGDGTTSSERNPTHRYAGAAAYTVRLVATDSAGQTGTVVKTVTVSAAPTAGGLTVEQAVARLLPNDPAGANADRIVGDREILRAIALWITNDPVPGTDGLKIDDVMIKTLISRWITAELI